MMAATLAKLDCLHAAQDHLHREIHVIQELLPPGLVSALAWSSDGTRLAVATLGEGAAIPLSPPIYLGNPFGRLITIFNSDGVVSQQIRRDKGFFTLDERIAFVADNTQIATPPPQESEASAFSIYNLGDGAEGREIPGPNPTSGRLTNRGTRIVVSPDQSILAVAFPIGRSVALYSTRDWKRVAELPYQSLGSAQAPHDLSFSGDGRFVAILGWGVIHIYSVASYQLIREFHVGQLATSIALNRDGSKFALGYSGRGTSVQILDSTQENILAREFHGHDAISGLTWSPDDRFVAFILGYRMLHLWSPFSRDTGTRVIDLGSSTVFSFSPDGRRIAAKSARAIKILNIGQ